jgi:hypothetical protein
MPISTSTLEGKHRLLGGEWRNLPECFGHLLRCEYYIQSEFPNELSAILNRLYDCLRGWPWRSGSWNGHELGRACQRLF